jgi:hypothetical protein
MLEMEENENPLKNVETFWQFHSYLAKIWDARKERNAGKILTRNPFNYSYARSPFTSFFEKTFGSDTDQPIFSDLCRADFFIELNQYQQALSFSWERSGYSQSEEPFTQKIKVFHEFFENAASQIWDKLVQKYELTPKEMLERLLPLFTLLSNEILVISESCLKMGITGLPYYEYYTVFNELLLKMQQLFKLAEVDEDIMLTVLELKNQLVTYAVIFGFPYFRGHASQAWCPEELIDVIEEENSIVAQEVGLIESLVGPAQMKKVSEWFARNKKMPASIPEIPEDAPLTDSVINQNMSVTVQFYAGTEIASLCHRFQDRFQLTEPQALLTLYKQFLPAEFQKLASAKKSKPKPTSSPLATAMATAPNEEVVFQPALVAYSKELDEIERSLCEASMLDPPSPQEIEFLLSIIKMPFDKSNEEESE